MRRCNGCLLGFIAVVAIFAALVGMLGGCAPVDCYFVSGATPQHCGWQQK